MSTVVREVTRRRYEYTDPVSLEQTVRPLWQEVLSRDYIGGHENFFALGGHSLHAVMMTNRISDALGSEIPLMLLFEAQTLSEYAVALLRLFGTEAADCTEQL